MLRFVLCLASALPLAACNMVVTDHPMIETSDEAPRLKPGIWDTTNAEDCSFDRQKPVRKWPECADPSLIGEAGEFLRYDREARRFVAVDEAELASTRWQHGDPMLAQQEWHDDETGVPLYFYVGFRPIERDRSGSISAYRFWLARCGPLDDPTGSAEADPTDGQVSTDNEDEESMGAEESGFSEVTSRPFADLIVVDDHCVPDGFAALRNAVVESEKLGGDTERRWIRVRTAADGR